MNFKRLESFHIFKKAFIATKREIAVSLVILLFVTLVFTLLMWIAESGSDNDFSLWDALVWIIAKYVEDPADITTPPVTIFGQFIGTLVGILGIAIFAVPAGFIGSGLIDAIEDDKQEEKIEKNSVSLRKRFRRIAQPLSWMRDEKGYKVTFKYVPRYRTFAHILVKTGMTNDDIINAVNYSPDMRLINLASTVKSDGNTQDQLAVAHFPLNNEYGCYIDRGSDVTIVAPVAVSEPGTGNFAFSMAAMGGFNYVSKELTPNPDDPFGFYTMQKSKLQLIGDNDMKQEVESQALHFIDDLLTLKENSEKRGRKHWFLFVMGTTKSELCQVHLWRLATDKEKLLPCRIAENTEYGSTVTNESEEVLQTVYNSIQTALQKREVVVKNNKQPIAVCLDNTGILKGIGASNIMRRVGGGIDCNAITLRIGYEILIYSNTHLLIAKDIADAIKKEIEPEREIPADALKCFMEEGDGFADDYGKSDVFEQDQFLLKAKIEAQRKTIRKRYLNRELGEK